MYDRKHRSHDSSDWSRVAKAKRLEQTEKPEASRAKFISSVEHLLVFRAEVVDVEQ